MCSRRLLCSLLPAPPPLLLLSLALDE